MRVACPIDVEERKGGLDDDRGGYASMLSPQSDNVRRLECVFEGLL